MNLSSRISDAARSLRRSRPFTAVCVLILALGIGANAAIFTIVNSILLKQLPLRNPGELVWVWVTLTDRDRAFFSIPHFLDTREQTRTFADLAAFANTGANLTGVDDPERLQGVLITPNAFELLGTGAAAGRTFVDDDSRAGGGRVAMLTYGLWQRRFGADAGIVGQSIFLNNEHYTVVGVLPRQFVFPVSTDAEFAAPLILETDPRRAERGSRFLRVFGRLKPNVTIDQARSELAAIFERLRAQYPADNGKHTAPRVLPLQTEIVGDYAAQASGSSPPEP